MRISAVGSRNIACLRSPATTHLKNSGRATNSALSLAVTLNTLAACAKRQTAKARPNKIHVHIDVVREQGAQRTSRSKESVKARALRSAYKMRPRAFRRSFASPYCLHQAKIASITGRNSVDLSVIA